MVVYPELHALSYFVLGGDSESINILDASDVSDYPWLLYIIPGSYDGGLINQQYERLNSDLLTYLFNNNETKFDFVGKSVQGPIFSMRYTLGARNNTYRFVERYIEQSSSEFLEIDKSSTDILTPFMGVGTKIPLSLGAKTIAALIQVCSSPSSTQGVLIGDANSARSILGDGLQAVRSVLFNYLEVVPGELSAPADMNIPIIYSEYSRPPSIVDICNSQLLGEPNTKRFYMISSVVRLANLLYSLIELDHGYRGLNPLWENSSTYPNDWYISTSTSHTRVPYRYPALVSLLAASSRRVDENSPITSMNLGELVKEWGKGTFLNKVICLKATSEDTLPLFEYMPKLCKSFFVQLYRHTCKGVISLPSNKEFPRRTEASRAFVTTFREYDTKSNLAGYLELADLLVQSSLLQYKEKLRDIVRMCSNTAYEIVLDPKVIPAIPVEGSIYKEEELLGLWRWNNYAVRYEKYSCVEVTTQWGEVANLGYLLEQSTLALLQHVEELCDSNEVYTLINPSSIEDMADYYGFYTSEITQDTVEQALIPRITFNDEFLKRISLKDILDYHDNLSTVGTSKVIATAAKLLKVSGIGTLVSGEPMYKDSRSYMRHLANLAVAQYLEKVLDSSRV